MTTKVVAQPTNTIWTTRVRQVIRGLVTFGVGLVSSYFYSKWAHFNTGQFAGLAAAVAGAYNAAIQWAETRFPRLGWLLGALAQPKKAAPAVGSTEVS